MESFNFLRKYNKSFLGGRGVSIRNYLRLENLGFSDKRGGLFYFRGVRSVDQEGPHPGM